MRRIGGSLKASLRASAKLKSFIRNNKTVGHRTQLFLFQAAYCIGQRITSNNATKAYRRASILVANRGFAGSFAATRV